MKLRPRIHHSIKYSELSPEWYDFFVANKIFPEIYLTAHEIDTLRQEQLLTLEKELHQRNLESSIHAPFLDLSPASADEKIRELTFQRLEQTLDFAEVIKPSFVVCHPNYDRLRFESRFEPWVDRCAKTFEPLVRKAERIRTTIAVENVFEHDPTPLERLVDKIASPRFGVCFDNGHFHLFHKVPLKKWWDSLRKKIVSLHLHDNRGEKDEHLPIGAGNFPFPAFFNLLKTSPAPQPITYTLECFTLTEAKASLKALLKFLD